MARREAGHCLVCLPLNDFLKGIGLSADYYVVINSVKTYGVEFNTGNIRFDKASVAGLIYRKDNRFVGNYLLCFLECFPTGACVNSKFAEFDVVKKIHVFVGMPVAVVVGVTIGPKVKISKRVGIVRSPTAEADVIGMSFHKVGTLFLGKNLKLNTESFKVRHKLLCDESNNVVGSAVVVKNDGVGQRAYAKLLKTLFPIFLCLCNIIDVDVDIGRFTVILTVWSICKLLRNEAFSYNGTIL